MSAPSVRQFRPHEWEAYRDLRLRALADSPDAFGATLADESLTSDWPQRLAQGILSGLDRPLVAELGDARVGLAWGKVLSEPPDHLRIFQMWVDPAFRNQGVGRSLLNDLLTWAPSLGVRVASLRVTCGDTPARRLYERAGFSPFGPPEPIRPNDHLLVQQMQLHLAIRQ